MARSSRSAHLTFAPGVPELVQKRLSYAFRVFAAIYGYRVTTTSEEAATHCVYGGAAESQPPHTVTIPARYAARPLNQPAPVPSLTTYAGETVSLFYGRDSQTGHPDWLAEIFEWLSGADEYSIQERDAVGRIRFVDSVIGRTGLSAATAHASQLMAWLENEFAGERSVEALPPAPSLHKDISHFVINTHDLDYYYVGFRSAVVRLGKNILIALRMWNRRYLFSTVRELSRLLAGERVGDFLPTLARVSEEQRLSATLFVLARRSHHRDANYALASIARALTHVSSDRFPVALHGSYESLSSRDRLAHELRLLESEGFIVRGNRQHWLRFASIGTLINVVSGCALSYDSSLGFSETPGFRNGAAFAFPPYDFAREEPSSFLEIPLIIMDASLERSAAPVASSSAILDESRRRGWGGVAVLWHNPFEAIEVSREVNDVYWKHLDARPSHGEVWMSAEEFLSRCAHRYQDAGLPIKDTTHAHPENRSGTARRLA